MTAQGAAARQQVAARGRCQVVQESPFRAAFRYGMAAFALCAILLAGVARAEDAQGHMTHGGWSFYGGDEGGQRYTGADEITPDNVSGLELAWRYRTGALKGKPKEVLARTAFETTPILVAGSLIFCTPYNEVVALDPATGDEKWRFDPHVPLTLRPANQYVCRGVAYWKDAATPEGQPCAERIFVATNHSRLIALDAQNGKVCGGFGSRITPGMADAGPDRLLVWPGEYQITSPPTVIHNVVIVGSAISDNVRTDAPSGVVRAFDARSGELLWAFDPLDPQNEESGLGHVGAANVWAPMSVDPKRGLVFLPTTSPSPDFYGGERSGDDALSDSVVALDAESGQVVWSFQTVHHDVWDYDLPAQPTLATIQHDGKPEDVVIQATKTGFLFVLDRDTGEPVFGVEERKVPQSDVPGEKLSPTQPYPVKPPALIPQKLKKGGSWGILAFDQLSCNRRLQHYRNEGLFTPPSLQGTIEYPFSGGGANWGGLAYDPRRELAVVNMNSLAHVITLIPRDKFKGEKETHEGAEMGPQAGTPYGVRRDLFLSPLGLPCTPPPWGYLIGVNMKTGEIAWRKPFGTVRDMTPFSLPLEWGVPSFGGPLVTKTGLTFIGAAMDNYIRAFSTETGKEVWKARLPAGGQATPMSYEWKGRQYVVIAAGGHARAGTKLGDYIMAYALPEKAGAGK